MRGIFFSKWFSKIGAAIKEMGRYIVNRTRQSGIEPLILALDEVASEDEIKDIIRRTKHINTLYGSDDNLAAIHYAIFREHPPSVVDALVAKGADLNIVAYNSWTPLHLAVQISACCVSKLLELGADINAPNKDGDSLLYCALHFGDLDTLRLLLENGVDTDRCNNSLSDSSLYVSIIEESIISSKHEKTIFLIKYIFLKNFRNDFWKLVKLMRDVSNLNPRYTGGEYIEFMESCIRELRLMKITKINPDSSVLDYAIFVKKPISKTLYTIPDQSVLCNMFPIYHDVITECIMLPLRRGSYMSKFRGKHLTFNLSFTNDGEVKGKIVPLHFNCIEKICSFLSDEDLIIFADAFNLK